MRFSRNQGTPSVFAGLPVDSVWTWLDRHSTVEFIQNPDEGLWNQPGWCAYFSAQTEGFLTNLFAIFATRAYLIKLSGNEDVTWSVTGFPSVKKIKWVPDSFKLVGFHVDATNPPNLKDFFSSSPAHADQAIYRLSRQGEWEFVENPAIITVQSGQAYWIYCEGASSYQSPLDITLPLIDGLDYGKILTEQTVTIRNLSKVTRTITLKLLSSAVVLAYRKYDPSAGYFTWPSLDDMPPLALAPGKQTNVRLAVRREEMTVSLAEAILEISDDRGIYVQVPVKVEKVGSL